jgi:beta-xylosidase
VDPTARYAFGHGLSYTEFTWEAPRLLSGPEVGPEGTVEVAVRVRNTGERHGSEVVQLYLHDPVAAVVRPVQRLVGFARLELAPGEAREARFAMPVHLAAFVGVDGDWMVEAGRLELRLSRSAAETVGAVGVDVTSTRRLEPGTRALETQVTVETVLV